MVLDVDLCAPFVESVGALLALYASATPDWSLLYFPYIADLAEVNWEAPCRVESRDDLVRAYLHAVGTTKDVLVPLSVNGYQHHPLVRRSVCLSVLYVCLSVCLVHGE